MPLNLTAPDAFLEIEWNGVLGRRIPENKYHSHHTALRPIVSTVLFTVEFDFEHLAKAVLGISLSNTHWIPLPNTIHWKEIALCG